MKARFIAPVASVVFLALLALPFGYYPLLSFGSVDGVHIDISLLYILVTLAVIVSLPQIIKNWRATWHLWSMRLLVVFAIYQTIAILWSPNTFRGIATAVFIWLLVGFVHAVIAWYPQLSSKNAQPIWHNSLMVMAAFLGLWTMWQIFGDAIGLDNWTLLPTSYQSEVFGVARPTGFSLEPQFFGSLLLIPFCWSLVQAIKNKRWIYWLLTTVSFAAILLTLSRGALLATAVAVIISLAALVRSWPTFGKVAASLLGGGLIAALIIFSAAEVNNHTGISGAEALRRSISQLTLGLVALPSYQETAHPSDKPTYIESSTDSRLSMGERAIKLWSSSLLSVLFGVGNGGFGAALHAKQPSFPIGSVVNNYYLEMIAELGIIGIGLFVAFIGALLARLFAQRRWLFVVPLFALCSQLWFFSGNANIVHVWAIIGLAAASLIVNTQINPKSRSTLLQ